MTEKRLPAHITEEDIRLISEIVVPVAIEAARDRIIFLEQQLAALQDDYGTLLGDLHVWRIRLQEILEGPK